MIQKDMTQQYSIKDYIYDDSIEDKKLCAFIENSMPDEVNIASVKRRTHLKMKKHRQHTIITAVTSIAAVLAVFVTLAITTMFHTSSTANSTLAEMPVEDVISIKVPVGEKMTIMLADGTRVVANSRSEVRYPKTFSGKTREVYAKGEVYFDVAHDSSHPFVVDADGMKVKVLGTKFCISNFSSARSSVVLLEGCVSATLKGSDTVTMHPGNLLSVSNGAFQSLEDVDASDYVSWMEGVLNLHGDDLSTVVRRLNDYYGTDIRIDSTITSPHLYGKLVYQKDIDGVLESINYLAHTHTALINGHKVVTK